MPAKLTGAEKLLRALQAAADDATDANTHKAAAELVVDAAGRLSHSSRVRASGRASATKTAGVARFGNASTPWAAPSHFGDLNRVQGGFMLPNPFMYRGADARADDVVELFYRRWNQAASSAGL
jgi:hypothetical protein